MNCRIEETKTYFQLLIEESKEPRHETTTKSLRDENDKLKKEIQDAFSKIREFQKDKHKTRLEHDKLQKRISEVEEKNNQLEKRLGAKIAEDCEATMKQLRKNKRDISQSKEGDLTDDAQDYIGEEGKGKRIKKSTDADEKISNNDGAAGNDEKTGESSELGVPMLKSEDEAQVNNNQSSNHSGQATSQNQVTMAQQPQYFINNHHHYYLSAPNHAPQSQMQASEQHVSSNIGDFLNHMQSLVANQQNAIADMRRNANE